MDIYQIFADYNPAWSTREIVWFSAFFCLCALFAFVLVCCKKITVPQAAAGLALLLFLGMVFGSTVFTRRPTGRKYELQLFWSWKKVFFEGNRALLKENLLNCVLLLPMGMLLPILLRRRVRLWQGFLYGFLMSSAIETCQLVFCRGLFEWDDMIHNGLGCMAGVAVVRGFLSFVHLVIYRRRKRAVSKN